MSLKGLTEFLKAVRFLSLALSLAFCLGPLHQLREMAGERGEVDEGLGRGIKRI